MDIQVLGDKHVKHVRNNLTVAKCSLEKGSVSHKLLGSVPIQHVHREIDT